MKKSIFALLLCLALVPAFVSCKKDRKKDALSNYKETRWLASIDNQFKCSLLFDTGKVVTLHRFDLDGAHVSQISAYYFMDNKYVTWNDNLYTDVVIKDGDKKAVL